MHVRSFLDRWCEPGRVAPSDLHPGIEALAQRIPDEADAQDET
jgi:hypothetical protein